MKNLPPDLEALMPEPDDYAVSQNNVTILYPPCGYAKAFGSARFTADQVRAAILGATERAAKLAADLAYDAAIKYANGRVVDFEQEVAAAIRGTA
jgi:hypothetical protein